MQQQQQQQQGGPQYGVTRPEMAPFLSPGAGPRTQILGIPTGPEHHPHHLHQQQQQMVAEAASPISSRPPPAGPSRTNFDELVPPSAPGSFPDEDALAAGEEVERGGVPGNRWPRQETLALLKIRSEMDATFRDATLKGPLWEDVSRKLADLGYSRSAKKCKEKFENVHKYYKRTKEGRAGRQDGKSYRFFTQLEALHSAATPTTTMATFIPALASVPTPSATVLAPFPAITSGTSSSMPSPPSVPQPPPISAPAPHPTATPASAAIDLTPTAAPPAIQGSAPTSATAAAAGISFSSDTCSSSSSEYDDEETEEGEGRKRKRGGGGTTGSSKMMSFFEGLMKQVMERQEAMQQRFLETIEKREHDRMIREEAWKRQEMARLNREHELMAQERAMAASRDAAVISFLQKISGQSTQLPPSGVVPSSPLPQPSPVPPQQPPPPPPPQQPQPPSQQPPQIQQPVQHHQKLAAPLPHPPPPQQQQQQQVVHLQTQSTEVIRHQPSSTSTALVPVPEPHEFIGSGSFEGVPSSRWPKSEVHALIKLRSDLESRYQEAGPKGPLWEEISAGMQRLGYSRSPKRCKEKWENINKYFKKVKESNKKRPEDAKTCPYFHQLDALYRRKLLASAGAGMLVNQRPPEHDPNTNPPPQERSDVLLSMAPPPAPHPHPHPHPETESKSGSGGIQIQTSNGGLPPSSFEEGASGGTALKKPEDIVKELMEQDHQQSAAMDDYDKLEEPDSDIDMDDDDDDDDDDGEDSKLQYKIQFQRQNVGGGGNASAAGKATGGAPAGAGGSFLAMVQ